MDRRRTSEFPLGSAVTLDELDVDPHPVLARLREREPVSWLPSLDGWLITRHDLALAALAAWTARYDSGEWDDPPGKLALLFDLERVAALLRDGLDPFHPDRDRTAFVRHLIDLGCQPPPGRRADQ